MPPKPAASDEPSAALPPALQLLAERGVQRRYRTRAMLIEEGDTGGAVYIVLAGRLRAFLSDTRGREVTLALHGPGEYVGEMSLDGGPRSASVQAVEPTLCAVVTRETMLQYVAEHPDFAFALIVRLIRRARLATESARSMALLDVYARLRRLLESRSAMAAEGGARRLAERLTHQAMASEIGCSREMVSRLLKDLEQGGYISVDRRQIVIERELPARW
ncbi:Crp/Fnr family transcriptional regulator [Variovorax sp. J22P168]|uniref:Crp/Fnr family transcriptional regulator n=1 Tax=Variovorax jilinensis TaxID=3053513 RepID=UPI0025773E4A|nr:Crp/Fnr family transcriptional regulator [Variovorax sp. J22P168]MDM0014081.1 Crp/Fnr family transcriptional regulator [Variovorax sp. J22P168]